MRALLDIILYFQRDLGFSSPMLLWMITTCSRGECHSRLDPVATVMNYSAQEMLLCLGCWFDQVWISASLLDHRARHAYDVAHISIGHEAWRLYWSSVVACSMNLHLAEWTVSGTWIIICKPFAILLLYRGGVWKLRGYIAFRYSCSSYPKWRIWKF